MIIADSRPKDDFIASNPFDPKDLPRFAQLSETAKDTLAKELTEFLTVTDSITDKERILPNIQKFSVGSSKDDLETVVNIIMAYADTPQKFPMISITSVSNRERKMALGGNYVATVQYPPSIVGTKLGPFNLASSFSTPYYLSIKTFPNGPLNDPVTSTITFSNSLFSDLTNVDIETLSRVVNKTQALYYSFESDSLGHLRISAGGLLGKSSQNSIEVVDGSSEVLNVLGFSIGDSDSFSNPNNSPKNRYGVASDMTINIDVVADSINTRSELSDLVNTFFTYYMEKRRFEFFGRSYFDRDLGHQEWYHIVLKNQFSWSSEVTRPRQGGEQYEQIYAVRGSVPIFIEDFIDKSLVNSPVWVSDTSLSICGAEDTDVTGDYGLIHE